MWQALKDALLRFEPETAHHHVIGLLKKYQWWHFRVRKSECAAPAIVIPAVPRLRFSSRVGLAAGFDKNAEVFAGLSRLGFGFVEVGTVTPKPQAGNPKPRIWRLPGEALVNSLGFNNCGLVRFRENLVRYRDAIPDFPIFANIGKGKETPNEMAVADYAAGFAALAHVADGFVINVSSPNTPGLRSLQTTEFLEQIAAEIPQGKPVWFKFAPDLSNAELKELCEWVKREPRATGIVLTNTSRALAEGAKFSAGGLSGRPLLGRSLECVGLARSVFRDEKVIIGVGGISSGEDARKMRKAGADLVEVYTSFIYRGPDVVREIAGALG